jgi:hypothetical protein
MKGQWHQLQQQQQQQQEQERQQEQQGCLRVRAPTYQLWMRH